MALTVPTFNQAGFTAAQQRTEQAGTQIDPFEYQSYGGSLDDYNQLYGATSYYNPDGSLTAAGQAAGIKAATPSGYQAFTTPAPAPEPYKPENFDEAGFQALQGTTAAEGTQITPQQALSFGIPLSQYGNLYQNTSWYNPDGTLTANAPQWLRPEVAPDPAADILFPETTLPEFVDRTVQVGPSPLAAFTPTTPSQSYRDFLPEDITATPLYEFQKQELLDELAKLHSARGLTNSGAELENNRRGLTQLLAEETERQRQAAEAQAIRQQERDIINTRLGTDVNALNVRNQLQQLLAQAGYDQDNISREQELGLTRAALANTGATDIADRLLQLRLDTADRAERRDIDQFNRLMDLLDLQLSFNPMRYAVPATDALAGLYGTEGDIQAQYLPSLVGGSGGGGASAPTVPVLPPLPAGPDYGAIDALGGLVDAGSNIETGNIFGNVLAGLFR